MEKGLKIWKRFIVHFTPKHASWLNQAEIEIGIMNRQCLGSKRFPCIKELRKSVTAWKNQMNKKEIRFNWTFTFEKAERAFRLND